MEGIKATAPWNSIDAKGNFLDDYIQDSMDTINKCLNCKYDACYNCLASRASKQEKVGRPKVEIDLDLLRLLLSTNTPTETLCQMFHCSKRTIYSRKAELLKGEKQR